MIGRTYMAGTQNKEKSFLMLTVNQSKFYAHSHNDVDPPISDTTTPQLLVCPTGPWLKKGRDCV